MSTGKLIGTVVAAIIGIMLLSWALGWIATPFGVTSSENVRKQWAFAYSLDEAMTAAATQVCSAKRALDAAQVQDERIQRQSQLTAYEQNYARIAAEFNAKMRNAFEAKLVKPSDVPDKAQTLEEKLKTVCAG